MSSPNTFPSANPFPILATFTIAGERRDRKNMSRSIPRLPVRRLVEEVQSFRREFAPAWNNAGHTVLLRGAHGSGKTHTIAAAFREGAEPLDGDTPGSIFALYTIQQDDNFLDFYRQIVAHLNKESGLWKKLARSLLATMTAEQWSNDLGTSNADDAVIAELQEDPEKLDRTFETYRVSRSGVMSRQEKALLDLTPSAFNKDLKAAIDALQGDKFDQIAVRWLSLDPITTDEQEAIGLSGPIENPDDALAAALLLISLLTNGGYKPVLVVDQFEKLLINTEPLIRRRNEGYLRLMIEGIRARNALLILSGSDGGWKSLPEDIKSRIGQRIIDCPLLTLDEALDLLRLYLTPVDAAFIPGSGSVYPLTLPAVKEMLTLSAGNPRSLLQFSHEAMRQAITMQTAVDDLVIRQIARTNALQYFDQQTVFAETRRVLSLQPLRLVEEFSLNGARFDFALLYEDSSVALLIEVSHAIFQDDEARNAYSTSSIQSRLRRSGVRVPLILIVTGYISPEVVENLSVVLQKLIVYSPDTFEGELLPILEAVRRNAAAIKPPVARDFEEKIESLLLRLAEQRGQQSVVIENRAVELVDAQARHEERIESARRDWGTLRRDLVEKMRTARQSRADEAQRQVNRQISVARYFWAARDVALLIVGFWLMTEGRRYLYLTHFGFQLAIFLPLGIAALDTLLALLLPSAWTDVRNSQDLNQFGMNIFAGTYGQIHAMNPVFRLVRYHARFGHRGIPRERLALIRKAACRDLSRLAPLDSSLWMIPEALILFENGVEIEGKPSGDIARAKELLGYLLFGSEEAESSFVTTLAFQVGRRRGPWFELVERGLDTFRQNSPPILVGDRSIREAIRSLSPFENGGLGTYDFLSSIDVVDDLFLFCSQALFYSERGVFSLPQSSSLQP